MSINPDVFAELKRGFERTTAPFVRVEKSLDEILELFHKMSVEFMNNSFYPYEMARRITVVQAESELPLYIQFLRKHPYQTLNEPRFWLGMKENPAIHDSYIAASLAATLYPKSEQLLAILSSAYHFEIPEIVAKVLAHPELTPLERLFELLFSSGTAAELNRVLDRFKDDPAPLPPMRLLSALTLNAPDLPQLKEKMFLLQNRGLNVAALILNDPRRILTNKPAVSQLEYLLSFLSAEEQAQVLDVPTCQYILNMAVLVGEIEEIKALLEFFKARQLPLQTILTQSMAGNPRRSLIEKLQANRLNNDALKLMESYLD
jgi:hypothetical protein